MTENEYKTFANVLKNVAHELNEYADKLSEGKHVDWEWSTYALDAQGAVYDLLVRDKVIDDPNA